MRGQLLRIPSAVEIFTEECCKCGIIFGLTRYFKNEAVNDHRTFYCPNGHAQSYLSESAAESNARLLREEQARHQRTLARANEAERREAQLKKRVKAGTCPCCKRTFKQLAAHMAHKHPEYTK